MLDRKQNKMNEIDIEFDFRQDGKRDPDADSQKLYELHKKLWLKVLPNGEKLEIEILNPNSSRILLKNNLTSNLSSDCMCPHFLGWKNCKYDNWLPEESNEEFRKKVRTIGGHIVFPAHRRDGFTINQGRGVNTKIRDRFDLTLECIKRYYKNMESPLYSTLKRYSDYFDLFVDFSGYINFFLLQDFIDQNGEVRFSIPFDNFNALYPCSRLATKDSKK